MAGPLLLRQVIKLTPKSVRARGYGIGVLVMDAAVEQTTKGEHLEVVYRARTPSKLRLHKVVIRQYGKHDQLMAGKLNPNLETWMHCTCEWFKFVCEVALARFKSSSVINSNGAMPKITNPKMIPMTCKHIVAVMMVNPTLNIVHKGLIAPKNTEPLELKSPKALQKEAPKIINTILEHKKQDKALDKELDNLL